MNDLIFKNLIEKHKLEITHSKVLIYVLDVLDKISKKGNKYKFVQTIDQNQKNNNYFFFGLQLLNQPIKNTFIYCQTSTMGDSNKIDFIINSFMDSAFAVKCNNCLWKSQPLCKNCENYYYFQPQETEEIKQLNTHSFVQADFKNEEEQELVDINKYFEKNIEAENFWNEYDKKKEG